MTVGELIKELQQYEDTQEIKILIDGVVPCDIHDYDIRRRDSYLAIVAYS